MPTERSKYSQQDEEHFIREAVKGIEKGRLLDLGACHPTWLSNSRALIESGWSAVLVDCNPYSLYTLAGFYGGTTPTPRVEVFQAAICAEGFQKKVQVQLTEDAVSTFDQATHEKWKDTVFYYGVMTAIAISVNDLLMHFPGPYDFVNIDLEGQSTEVFFHFLSLAHAQGWAPRCICIEYDNELVAVKARALSAGYAITHDNGTNLILEKACTS